MSTVTPVRRPHSLEELKRAWQALDAGHFRNPTRSGHPQVSVPNGCDIEWVPATGERTVAVFGCGGSVGASTLALGMALNAPNPVRVLECCSATTSGLASAATAELGLNASGWRQGKRDHVLIERTSDMFTGPIDVPPPTVSDEEHQLTILDIGWEASQVLGTDCWLADTARGAGHVVLVTTATIPGIRRLESVLAALGHRPEDRLGDRLGYQITVAVLGPRRKKWPKGVEQAGGAAIRHVLSGDRFVEVPLDRDLQIRGLDTRPIPTAVLTAAARISVPDTHSDEQDRSERNHP